MPDRMAAATRQREAAERYVAQVRARGQRAERVVAKVLGFERSIDHGQGTGPEVEQRRIDAEVTVRLGRLAEPRDQLFYPKLDGLDPYFLAVSDVQILLYALLDVALQHTR